MARNLLISILLGALGASADVLLGSPEMTPSSVDPNGAVREDWGVFALRIETPPGAQTTGQDYSVAPSPQTLTTSAAGAVALRQTAYRSPIAPAGVDVVEAVIENTGAEAAPVRLAVSLPKEMGLGEAVGVLGGRPVLALPQNATPVRKAKEWGCTGGVVAMPGWAAPEGECDPAFKNISAGMGGVPIEYRFAVPAHEHRKVVLGFCESFHSQAGTRPLAVDVEGTEKTECDPLAAWGRHVPGCLLFDAADADGDGFITVRVSPGSHASDTNPILNVIWVFKPDAVVDLEAVKKGVLSSAAERYVDVGGTNDQTLYEDGPFAYELNLAPGQKQELMFLLAAPESTVPNPKTMTWTSDSLRKAADEIWQDWFKPSATLRRDDAQEQRKAAVRILLCRTQAGGFFLALPEAGRIDQFSQEKAAAMIASLDDWGLFKEAERLLMIDWRKPAPAPFAAFAQKDDGSWEDAAKDPAATAYALQSLTRHALVAKGSDWIVDAWPAIKAGAAYLAKPEAQDALSPEAKQVAKEALVYTEQLANTSPNLANWPAP